MKVMWQAGIQNPRSDPGFASETWCWLPYAAQFPLVHIILIHHQWKSKNIFSNKHESFYDNGFEYITVSVTETQKVLNQYFIFALVVIRPNQKITKTRSRWAGQFSYFHHSWVDLDSRSSSPVLIFAQNPCKNPHVIDLYHNLFITLLLGSQKQKTMFS